jgi:hypothetical protein
LADLPNDCLVERIRADHDADAPQGRIDCPHISTPAIGVRGVHQVQPVQIVDLPLLEQQRPVGADENRRVVQLFPVLLVHADADHQVMIACQLTQALCHRTGDGFGQTVSLGVSPAQDG